ncbi:MAG TPA: hypothetical protein VKR29_12660 [Candidatus Binataceae bacterium]|nr:hypothetical protein [Candidatus Binataceae bacterium]
MAAKPIAHAKETINESTAMDEESTPTRIFMFRYKRKSDTIGIVPYFSTPRFQGEPSG